MFKDTEENSEAGVENVCKGWIARISTKKTYSSDCDGDDDGYDYENDV